MRALGHPDVFLPTDVGIRHALTRLGPRPRHRRGASSDVAALAVYAQLHLWQTSSVAEPDNEGELTCGP